ncbi:TetR/AcrR family transcriptional regulator [Agromyces aerolatus]|uniref:TetR/AcrR family transcriptional regulator n=1 Tax=Agromyces sp. LY-1074 TaxID=3074080 RepID=UPI002855A17C|nr:MULTISPECIES: TetR/AcrR family transcriptional regulator [unclassified Agromyces]MDR5701606.1 TetR/AcrR family transcriptional regulator [Agromyces sp. LY-1074]MDR5706136.1 TetR/AcrR family transcriptional regulator [Agromyces sp. LY-1358]
MSDTAYQAILEAARTKFAEVGYRDVTIRSIAAEAGYSAAMVMKLMGSKEQLFWLVAPGVASTAGLEEERELVPKADVGRELVRRIFARRRMGAGDPYAVAPLHIASAPEPEQIRDEIRDRYLHNMAAMIGDSTPDQRHAKAVVSILFGIAASVHTLDAYDPADDDEAIETFAALAQTVIDRTDGPRIPLPDESVGISAGNRAT